MWWDNFKWLLKDGELNPYYISSGLDVRDNKNISDFIPHSYFCYIRDLGNQKIIHTNTGDYNYLAAIRDKYIFTEFLTSVMGKEKVVQNYAMISMGEVYIINNRKWISLDELFDKNDKLVVKLNLGECAEGVYVFEKIKGIYYLNGSKTNIAELKEIIGKNNFVVQNFVIQHELLRKFKTKSVNTIRIVTFKGKTGAINVFAAFLRLGNTADTFVDNRAVGGLAIGIDLQTGKLMKYGIPHDEFGTLAEEHKLSGIRFEGLQLPYWKETEQLVKDAHKHFYTMQTIGWDVILTDYGPVILEGNDAWEIGGPQDTSGGLKSRWKELSNR